MYWWFLIIVFEICEAESAIGKNVAYKKDVYESSTYNHQLTANAVDDDAMSSCSTTEKDATPPWLVVDLKIPYQIGSVNTTVNLDTSKYVPVGKISILKMNDFDRNSNPPNVSLHDLCGEYEYEGKENKTFQCSGKAGTPSYRYIAVVGSAENGLGVCNLEVYGAEVNETFDSFIGFYKDIERVTKTETKSASACAQVCRDEGHQWYTFKTQVCDCVLKISHIETEEDNSSYSVHRVCPIGLYGSHCDESCHCTQNLPCDGEGICASGCHESFLGKHCDEVKRSSLKLGCKDSEESDILKECHETCDFRNKDIFYIKNHTCECDDLKGSLNESCGTEDVEKYTVCPPGFYGYKCSKACHCNGNSSCSLESGKCQEGCEAGWDGPACDKMKCSNETLNVLGVNTTNGVRCVNVGGGHSLDECQEGFARQSVWLPCEQIPKVSNGKLRMYKIILPILIITSIILIFVNLLAIKNLRRLLKERRIEEKTSLGLD